MKQPSDLTPYISPSVTNRDTLTGDGLPSLPARIHLATVLLRDLAEDAHRAADAEAGPGSTAGGRSATGREIDVWRNVAAVLADAEWPEQNGELSPEGRLANAFSLSRINDYCGFAMMNFDLHYALVELAKANLMLARLTTLRDENALPGYLTDVEAELSATLDALLDAIPDLAGDHAKERHQFAA